jgi:hypothetical protein
VAANGVDQDSIDDAEAKLHRNLLVVTVLLSCKQNTEYTNPMPQDDAFKFSQLGPASLTCSSATGRVVMACRERLDELIICIQNAGRLCLRFRQEMTNHSVKPGSEEKRTFSRDGGSYESFQWTPIFH